jgi:predicted  nucleic acid-binding Zn-ribbon protein
VFSITIPEAEKAKKELAAANAEIAALKVKLAELEAPIIAAAKAKADLENDLISLFG